MPRIPILSFIDWRRLVDDGLPWNTWLDTADKPEHRAELVASYERFVPSREAVRAVRALAQPVHALAIAEPWCGDVRRHIPVLQHLADQGDRLTVRYVGRHQALDAFERHLTNGGEAIPKVVFLNPRFVETGNWGPMPGGGRRLIARGKAANDLANARRLVKELYDADPERREVERELLDRLDIAATAGFAPATPVQVPLMVT